MVIIKIILFNKEEQYISSLRDTISIHHLEELNGEDTLEIEALDVQIEKNYRIAYKSIYGYWHEFIVKGVDEEHTDDGIVKRIFCESSFYETLGDYIEDKRPYDVPANTALEHALSTTRWQVGHVDDLGINSTNFYHISAKEAVQMVAGIWKGELRTRIVVVGNKIVGRYVDLFARRGQDIGKRFTYTKDIESITRIIHRDDVITALYGYGKGIASENDEGDPTGGFGRRLSFKDINNDKAYVENNEARLLWGRGPERMHVFGKVEFDDCENPHELLQLTNEKLEEVSKPLVTYEAQIIDLKALGVDHEGVELGDTVTVIDNELKLRAKARVIQIERDLLEPSNNVILIGNFIANINDIIQRQEEYINNFRDKQSIWDKSSIISNDYTLNTQYLNGVIDVLKTKLESTQSGWYTDDNGNIIFENHDKTESMMLTGSGFMIANSKLPDGSYNYRAFGTGAGFTADEIITGLLKGGKVKFDLTNGTLLIGNGIDDYSLYFDGSSLKIRLEGKTLEEKFEDIEPIPGPPGVSVKSVDVMYYLSNSPLFLTGGSWQTEAPTWSEDKYMWSKVVTTYDNEETSESKPVCITGSGGVSIASVTEYYAVSSSSTVEPTGWETTAPQMTSTNKYLWNYEEINFSDGTTSSTNKRVIGAYGDNGADGNSILSVTNYYLASASGSGVTTSTPGWTIAVQSPTVTKKYLWNYEVIKYTKIADTITTPTIIGAYGDTGSQGLQGLQGPKGDQGIQGVDGKASYTHIAYATNATGTAGFSTSDPTNKTYIGMYVDNVATDSTDPSKYKWSLIKGADGSQGIPGTKGADGLTPYLHIAYATNADGTTGFSTTVSAGKTYIGQYTDYIQNDSVDPSKYKWSLIKGDTGARGATGERGPQGATGTSVSNVTEYYQVSASGTTAPTSWVTTMPTMTTTNKYLWNYEKISFSDGTNQDTIPVVIGVYGNTGSTGATGRSITAITEYYLATSAASGVTRSTNGWTTTIQTTTPSAKYLWNYEKITWSSGTTTTYVEPIIIGIHGETGPKGDQGIQGPKGADGVQYYTWLKYADTPTTGMSNSPTNKKYMGIAYNKTTATESSTYADYSWSLIQGPQGNQGIQGPKGTDGQPTYTWIKYATTPTSGMVDTPTSNTPYIGIAYNKTTATESTKYADYTWSLIKGADGATGKGITSITEEYYLSTSKTTQTGGSWVTTPPTWKPYHYMWTRSKIVYNNPTSTEWTTPLCDSSWEAVNEVEIGGRNLVLNSGVRYENASYPVKSYDLSEILVRGTVYTYQIKGVLAQGATGFLFYSNKGLSFGMNLSYQKYDPIKGIYYGTFTCSDIQTSPTDILNSVNIYSWPKQAGETAIIEWVKLEKGNKATDWTPAPEDVQADIETRVKTTDFVIEQGKIATLIGDIYTQTDSQGNPISSSSKVSKLEQNVNGFKTKVSSLEASVNEKPSQWFYAVAPTLSNAPYNTWTTVAIRDKHINDLYTNTVTGYIYRFIKTGSTYSWAKLTDQDLTNARTRLSTAESKITPTAIINTVEQQVSAGGTTLAQKSDITQTMDAWVAKFDYLKSPMPFRYIRSSMQSVAISGYNIVTWTELEVIANGVNVAKGKTVTASHSTLLNLSRYTDGNNYNTAVVLMNALVGTWYHLQVDLGQVYNNISSILDYKVFTTAIAYKSKIQVSENGTTWVTLFDGTTSSSTNTVVLKGFQQGITTINAEGVKVEHSGLGGQYSQVRADGFVRKYEHGEASYLNGVFAETYRGNFTRLTERPPAVVISLPEYFRGRKNDVKILLSPINIFLSIGTLNSGGTVQGLSQGVYIVLNKISDNFDIAIPTITVDAYVQTTWKNSGGALGRDYYRLDFSLMIVGK